MKFTTVTYHSSLVTRYRGRGTSRNRGVIQEEIASLRDTLLEPVR